MRRGFPIIIAAICAVLPSRMAAAQDPEPAPAPDAVSRSVGTSAVALAPSFQSDGCTWWFDGDHKACCVKHDRAYAEAVNWRDRLGADNRLCGCIWRTPGWWHKPMAPVMWAGVHVVHRGIRPLLGVLHLRRSPR